MSTKPPTYWQQGVFAVLLAAGVVAFNFWTVLSVTPRAVTLWGGDQGDYSNLVMHSLLKGHLYVDITPPPALVHAENPYDPAKRPPGIAIADASLYKGHYYMYFGVAPVVTLFLPWRLVTGHDLPTPYAALILVNGAFLAAAALWWMLRRRYFPDSGILALAIGILVIGLASMTYAVLRRTSIWEPPVAAGYLFATWALLALYLGVHRARRLTWFALASACLGLAVGSRPTYAVATSALAVPLLLDWWRGRREGRLKIWPDAPWWRQALALGGPFALIFAALLAYNYARFDNPFEFGMRYQLTGTYEMMVRHFSAAYLPFNATVYFLSPAQWSRYFPFVEPIHLPAAPAGYYTSEYVYGVLTNLPFAWLALLAPLALRGRGPGERWTLLATLGSIAVLFATLALLLCCFVTSTARYMVDFVPALMFLACVGLLAVERLAARRVTRGLMLAAATLLAAASVFVGAMLNFQLQDLLRQLNRPLFTALGHAFDQPAWLVERRTGTQFGPVEMTLRFPQGQTGRYEPLVVTGWEFASDHLFVDYVDRDKVRFGFTHAGQPIRWSDVCTIDYRAEHRLWVGMGSLLPPREHPFFDGWSPQEYSAVGQWLHVVLDDRVVLDGPQIFSPASPGSQRFGTDPAKSFGDRFTGRILRLTRGPVVPPAFPSAPGAPVQLTIAIPTDAAQRQLPIVTSGSWGRGDALIMRATRPGVIRFYYDHWGDDLLDSGDVSIGGTDVHHLIVSFPALWSAGSGPASPLASKLYLALDGRVLATQDVPGFLAKPGTAAFGHNGIESPLCEAEYPWPIREVRPVPAAALPRAGSDPVPRWQAPAPGNGVQREPLDLRQKPVSEAARAATSLRRFCAAAYVWGILMIWILGRMAGVAWSAFFARLARAVTRPLRRPARWAWHHRIPVSLALAAAALGIVGWERHVAYLRAIGPVRIRLMLPMDRWSRQQPLLCTGRTGAGAMVFVKYADRTHIQIGGDIWGTFYLSDPIAADYSEPQEIVVNASGLYPLDHPGATALTSATLRRLRNEFFVAVGGRTVLFEPRSAYESSVADVRVGENRIASSFTQPRFAGRIVSVDRLPAVREFRVERGQGVRVRFKLNPQAGPPIQPLLSLGVDGRLGVCTVQTVSASAVRLRYRAPDGTVAESGRFANDADTVHELEVVPGFVDTASPRAAAWMSLDGVRVAAPSGFTPYATCPVTVGLDWGARPGIDQFFSGPELTAHRFTAVAPGPAPVRPGVLRLVVLFPGDQTGGDPLVVSGAPHAGDFLFVEYLAGDRLCFGWDHWGLGGRTSDAIPFDPRVPHRLDIETASLVPSASGQATAGPVRVQFDGATVLDGVSSVYPHTAQQIFIGSNPIGGTTAGDRFRGQILLREGPGRDAPGDP